MRRQIFTLIGGILIASLLCVFNQGRPAAAVTGGEWQAGVIIDDGIFYNNNDMSADDIQRFLNAKVPNCDTWGAQSSELGGGTRAQYGTSRGYPPPYVCLKDYYETWDTHDNNLQGRPVPAGAWSAAQIIKHAADTYGVSVRVLLTTLQKESPGPLITDTWPFYSQYRNAMGYGCPDTAPCDPAYAGFYNQIHNAARQFRLYSNNSKNYRYKPYQANAIQYNPNTGCGTSGVVVETKATAGLYNYTPYQPNQAALNNLYGTGDSCSAYGNRNFWRLFHDWFGATRDYDTTIPHPDGTLIDLDSKVYVVENGARHLVQSPAVFESYNFRWDLIKQPTSGDKQLPEGYRLDIMRAGRPFAAPNTPVYVMGLEGGVWKKQHLTYEAFMQLGYNWNDVLQVSPNDIPEATASIKFVSTDTHPEGTLLNYNNAIYFLWGNQLRHVDPYAFDSANFKWDRVKEAKDGDKTKAIGTPWPLREGTMIRNDSSIFAVDHNSDGTPIKRPIGPWACFADRMKYELGRDVFPLPDSFMPVPNGPSIQC
jgi:hypothetical protein